MITAKKTVLNFMRAHINCNMKFDKTAFIFCLAGFLFTVAFGALSHFIYQWSGRNRIAALFFPVNESTWEHLKLVFFPAFLYFAVAAVVTGKRYSAAAFLCVLMAAALIVAIFYSYTAIVGKSYVIADILTFVVAVFAGYVVAYFVLTSDINSALNNVSLAGIAAIVVLCFCFTYFTPQCFLFRDPVSGGYGIAQ